jgi:hypothetical protein
MGLITTVKGLTTLECKLYTISDSVLMYCYGCTPLGLRGYEFLLHSIYYHHARYASAFSVGSLACMAYVIGYMYCTSPLHTLLDLTTVPGALPGSRATWLCTLVRTGSPGRRAYTRWYGDAA